MAPSMALSASVHSKQTLLATLFEPPFDIEAFHPRILSWASESWFLTVSAMYLGKHRSRGANTTRPVVDVEASQTTGHPDRFDRMQFQIDVALY